MRTSRVSPVAPMITRAQKRRRRLAWREAVSARRTLIQFTLAWAAGDLDHLPHPEFEAQRNAAIWDYRRAVERHARVLAELAS